MRKLTKHLTALVAPVALIAVLTLPLAAHASVADTYEIESGKAGGIASNVAIDIISHGSPLGVWMATGKGVNYSDDDGASWFVYNTTHGLPSENLSAIFSIDGRIWLGSNHGEIIQDQLMNLSDGLTYSKDDGETWVTLDFGPNGFNIPFVEGGDRTIFDITGHTDIGFMGNMPNDTTDWLFFSAFAGGLLASQDGGDSWRRIFPSSFDSAQYNRDYEAPSFRNRYFSCAADTSHGDSLFLWAGSAAGIFQYVFATPRDKLYSQSVSSVAICDSCGDANGSRLFFGGDGGVILGSAGGGDLTTRFEVDGLPGAATSAIFSIGDKLLVGCVDTVTGLSAGLAVSTDDGETYTANGGLGTADLISEFVQMGSRVYAAVQSAGLWVSADSGQFWQQVPFDTLNADQNLHVANALATLADTLIVGTDAGIVNLTLDAGGDIIAFTNVPMADTDSTGAKVVRLRHQIWTDDYTDHTILWTVQQPDTTGGIPMIGRYGPITADSLFDTTFDTVVVDPLEIDTLIGLTFDTLSFSWSQFRKGANTRDLNFFSDTVFVVGDLSVWFSPRGGEPTNFFSVRQFVDDTLVVANLDSDTVTAMVVRQDTVIFTTYNGVAVSTDRGQSFRIYRPNFDPLTADVVINHTFFSSNFGLAGNFIPAIGVQYQTSGPARIWAGARPSDFGSQGISAAEFDDSTGAIKWQTVLTDDFAWNFEFMGDTVLAATNNGLLMGDSQLDSLNTVWETISFTDMTSGKVLVEPGTSVFGVERVGEFVWVGTDDGTIRLDYTNFASQRLFQRVDSTTAPNEVYAFPVPFRPNRLQSVDFHYTVEDPGTVTLEIYDFAMNLVATPIDNVYHADGIYPDQGSQGFTWDGLNDRGDLVAVGVYYFKVEFESGETRWGKLAVIP